MADNFHHALGTGAANAAAGDHTHTGQQNFYPHDAGRSNVNASAAASHYGDYVSGIFNDGAKGYSFYTGYFAAAPASVKVAVIPLGTGDLAWYTTSVFAGSGETYTTNTDAQGSDGTPQTTAVVADKMTEIDVTDSFTGAATGDYFGLQFVRDGNDAADTVGATVHILGVRVTY